MIKPVTWMNDHGAITSFDHGRKAWEASGISATALVRLSDAQAAIAEKDRRIAVLCDEVVNAWNSFGVVEWAASDIADLPYMTGGTLAEQIEELVSQRDTAESEAARLRALLAEAREVVEPFAKVKTADGYPDGFLRIPDEHGMLFNATDALGETTNWEPVVLIGHLRAARALAEKLEKETGNE